MKKLALVLALTLVGATAASAQNIQFRVGPDNDRGYDRGSRERVIVRERRARDFDDDRVVVRRRDRDVTGSVNCRTTIVKRENARGDMVTKRIRQCD